METLSLKFGSVKEMLTKDQMKKINGGKLATCTWTWNGNSGCAAGTSVTSDTQEEADSYCEVNDCCDNVDCV